jgi:hypothetical protein
MHTLTADALRIAIQDNAMSNLNRKPKKQWADSHIWGDGDTDIVIHRQRENIGYGFTSIYFVGTLDAVVSACKREMSNYPPQGYGGRYSDPEDLGNGLFLIFGRHSESCE